MKSTGMLRYSPKLLGDRQSSKWWLVLDCDDEISKLYRNLYWLNHHKTRELKRPAWSTHITIVRNEEPSEDRKYLWELHDGESVEFDYKSCIQTNGEYFWFAVESDILLDIREELGLERDPFYPLHLSIGHLPQEKI